MASKWEKARLGDLVNVTTGRLDSNAAVPGGKYPFFTCSQETLRTNTFSFDTECVLLAGNNANGIYPLKYFNGKFDAYQRTYVLTSRDASRLATRFLYYALRPKLSEFRSISTGVATKFLTLTILNETELQVPPLPVQQRLSGILAAYDELIANSQRRIEILEAIARTLYREWFVQFRFPGHESSPRVASPLGDIPQGWGVRKVAEFVDFTRGFEPGADAYHKEPAINRIKFLRVGDLSKRDSGLYIEGRLAGSRVLKPFDIAITLDGSVGQVRLGLAGAYSSGIRRIDVKDSSRVGWSFLYQLLLSDGIQATIEAHAKGTTIKHAGSAVAALAFVSPPPEMIDKFEHLAAPSLKLALSLQNQIDNLRRTRDLLLVRLLSGEVDLEKVESRRRADRDARAASRA